MDVSAGYNSANRLTNMVQSGLGTINLGWANGRLIQESGPWPNSTVTRVFPAHAFRPNELRVQNNATPTPDWVVAYGYDSSGRLQNLTSPVGPFTYSYTGAAGSGYAGGVVNEIQLPRGGKVNHDWDGLGRLALTEFRNNPANGSAVQNRHTYLYDLANRRNQQVRTGSSAVTLNYGYDDLGQLTSASIVGGASTAYGYDGGWNMTNRAGQAYTVNDFNQVTAGEGFNYSYDANGNRTLRSTTSTGQFIQYTYDDENRLIVAQTDNVATAEQGRWRTEFTYDGFGRLRHRRELNWQFGGWYETTQTRYLYDGWRVVQERAGTLPQVAYTRGLDLSGSLEGAGGIGGLLARSSGYQSASGTYSSHAFYHADGGGNVTFLNPSTYTGSEAALTRYVYDALGRTTSATGPLWSANLYRFSSKEVHVASGMYYYGYRFYDPQRQRWLNRDPNGEYGGWNLYGFVGGDPNDIVDPLGLFGKVWFRDGTSITLNDLESLVSVLYNASDPSVELLRLSGHSGPHGLLFGNSEDIFTSDGSRITLGVGTNVFDVTEELKRVMNKNSRVELNGCYTGFGPENVLKHTSEVLDEVDVAGYQGLTWGGAGGIWGVGSGVGGWLFQGNVVGRPVVYRDGGVVSGSRGSIYIPKPKIPWKRPIKGY